MASLTYVCFVPAKGLIRDLLANSSNIAFKVPLASNTMFDELAERSLMSTLAGTKHTCTYVRLAIIIHCQILAFFQILVIACK